MSDAELERKLARLDALEALFDTEGWHHLMLDMAEEHERLGKIDNITTAEQLAVHKAVRDSLYVLIHYPDVCAIERRNLEEQPAEEEDDGA